MPLSLFCIAAIAVGAEYRIAPADHVKRDDAHVVALPSPNIRRSFSKSIPPWHHGTLETKPRPSPHCPRNPHSHLKSLFPFLLLQILTENKWHCVHAPVLRRSVCGGLDGRDELICRKNLHVVSTLLISGGCVHRLRTTYASSNSRSRNPAPVKNEKMPDFMSRFTGLHLVCSFISSRLSASPLRSCPLDRRRFPTSPCGSTREVRG